MRSLAFNLRDPQNPDLRGHVLTGEISAANLVRMSAADLANKDLAEWRRKIEEEHNKAIELDVETAAKVGLTGGGRGGVHLLLMLLVGAATGQQQSGDAGANTPVGCIHGVVVGPVKAVPHSSSFVLVFCVRVVLLQSCAVVLVVVVVAEVLIIAGRSHSHRYLLPAL